MSTMKKIAFLILGISLTASVMAQTDPKKAADMKELRTDVRQKQAASHKVNHDITHAKVKKAVHDHKAVAREKKEIRSDSKQLKNRGVSHPVAKAKRQVKVQDDNRKDHTN
jgi:homoaconitase/3-isopropylmalate dehydratase large subunit